jgi:alkanesulfonate monooxygenase SsuD/methylene tetrahydromethanopterin reductase-like flavin-dependent oxidoreductase (luciferase family)
MNLMDIGVFLAAEPHERGPAEDLREFIDLAQAVEELGYSSLWTASRHFSAGYAAIPSPLVIFAAVAERTKTLVFGPSVVTLPLENLHRLAEDFAVLDAISGGRARLGVGSGDDPVGFEAMGVPFDDRAGIMSAQLPKLLDMLQGGDVGAGLTLYPPVDNALDKVALGAQSARGAAWAASMGIGLLQGRSEPNSWDPTISQTRAAEAYRAVHPEGRIVTARNAWVGTLNDPELLEGIRRHDEFNQACTIAPDDVILKATGSKPAPHEDERDAGLIREVWVKASSGVAVGSWEPDIPADAYRVRRLVAHWMEQGALQAN